MEDFNSYFTGQGVLGKGLVSVVIFLVLLLSFIFVLRLRTPGSRMDTSLLKKMPANDTAKAVFATGEDKPQCIKLSAGPLKGGARLSVTFVAEGSAVNGVVRNFEFAFGDGKIETVSGVESKGISTATTFHIYDKPGKYAAAVRVRDVFDKWSEPTGSCKQEITVEGEVLSN